MSSGDIVKRIIDSKCPPANYGACGTLVSAALGHGAENTKILKSPSNPLFPRRLRRLQNDLVTRYRANPDGLRGHVGRALAIAISG